MHCWHPADTDEYMFCDVTVNVPPASITAKSGQNITLPACSTEMTRYPRNRYGEDGVGYEFDKWNTSSDGSGSLTAIGPDS